MRRVSALAVFLIPLTLSAQDGPPPKGPPEGIEVQARGPVHEAFASATTDPVPTRLVPKRPPDPIDELPPDQKPEGDAVWIGGYWAYDDDAKGFLWVSGVWRRQPANKTWVAGYWREEGTSHQWVPGFWAASKAEEKQEITYLPPPPDAPAVAAPGKPPVADAFFVPGNWVWRGTAYAWRPGYWARPQPGYVWIADHYRWSPTGYVYVEGYWDLALPRRGILYAPVVIRASALPVGYVYTPTYAVNDTVIVNAMFVRPSVTHYYFGDYYGTAYTDLGYESCVVYSRRRYEPVIVYETCYRRDPAWLTVQINLYNDRCAGRAPVPPRTLVQQNTFVNNTTTNVTNVTRVTNVTNVTNVNNITMIAPPAQVAAAKETKLVKLDTTTRQAAKAQAANVQSVASQRSVSEVKTPPGAPRVARSAALSVPKAEPVKAGMAMPKAPPAAPQADAGAKLGTPTVKTPEARTPGTLTSGGTPPKVATPPVTPKVTTAPPVTPKGPTTPPVSPKVTPSQPPPMMPKAGPPPKGPPAKGPPPKRTPPDKERRG